MGENVGPILSEGIIEICDKVPDDPIEFLVIIYIYIYINI